MVSKAVMKSSQDRIKGTDKKGEVLWDQVWKTYSVLLKQYNILYSKKQPDKFRPFNSRTKASVKNQWNGKIQPCINKFASLVATNQPKSGYVEDDARMDLYWGEMRQLYAERAEKHKSLPKNMDIYFQSYMWLRDQPRFEQHFGPDNNDTGQGKGKKKRKERTGGRDTGKKVKIVEDAVDRMKSKVTAAVLSDSGKKAATNQDETQKFRCVIEDGFKAINKSTNQLVMNQVMSEAPPSEKAGYCGDGCRKICYLCHNGFKKSMAAV